DQAWIDVEVVADVDVHGAGARGNDRTRRGDEAVRRADHLVARADAERLEREEQRVSPGADADGIAARAEPGEALLELLNRRAERELGRLEQPLDVPKDRFGVGKLLPEVRVVHAHRLNTLLMVTILAAHIGPSPQAYRQIASRS